MKPETKIFLFLAFVATVLLMLVSPDSYMYDLWCHSDSAWFFMSGKAWMSGMKPYVDFADSKGPLLWLIYGVGYLISPTDYTGVYWISCLVYAVTYFCVYKIARLLLGSRGLAVGVSVLMSLSFFYPYVHHEIRCEDFNQMLMAIVLWLTCKLLYGRNDDAGKRVSRVSFGIGVCVAASLLIKYNVTPMLAFPMLFVLHWSWKRGCGVVKPILWCLLGVVVITLPMMIYLWATGCIKAFVQEYFINTLTVVGDSHDSMGGVLSRFMGHWLSVGLLLAIGLVGAVAMVFQLKRYRFFPLAMYLVVVLLTVTHATWTFHYGTCLIFPVFALIAVAKAVKNRSLGLFMSRPVVVAAVTLLSILATTVVNWHKQGDALFFKHDVRSADQYRFAAMMSDVKNPRVVYYFTGPYPEYGIQLHSLPGCVYWASQSGSTEEMDQYQRDVAREGRADFIFTLHGSKAGEKLEAMGYHRYESSPVPGEQYRLDLFSRRELQKPPKPWMPTPKDILFKRNPFSPIQ